MLLAPFNSSESSSAHGTKTLTAVALLFHKVLGNLEWKIS